MSLARDRSEVSGHAVLTQAGLVSQAEEILVTLPRYHGKRAPCVPALSVVLSAELGGLCEGLGKEPWVEIRTLLPIRVEVRVVTHPTPAGRLSAPIFRVPDGDDVQATGDHQVAEDPLEPPEA